MFHMVNDVGNAHRFTASAAGRDELLQLGYTEVETPAAVGTPEKPKAAGGKGKKTDKTDKKED